MTNAFYHRIQKLCVQCQFSDDKECLVDAIIYGTRVHKAREKLLQMPKCLTLCDCLKICRHYESLSYHLNIVKPEKPVESFTKCCFARGGKQKQQQQLPATMTDTFKGQPSTRPTNSSNKTVPCSYCGMTYPKDRCQPIDQPASIATEWVIFRLCADLLITVLVIPKTQGSLTGSVVEAEHPKVKVLHEDR